MFDQATTYTSRMAENLAIPKALRPPGLPLQLVGQKRAARPGPTRASKPSPAPILIEMNNSYRGPARRPSAGRQARRRERERLMKFREAAAFAHEMDMPLTTAITLSWDALIQAGEGNEGHCLGRGEWEREAYLRRELARLCKSEGKPFAAIWGRDVGREIGLHVHMSMWWPSRHLQKLVAVIERVTGSAAAFVVNGYADTVARSVCGGWQINMNNRHDAFEGAQDYAGYIASQHAKHPAPPDLRGKAFGISKAIGPSAQKAAAHILAEHQAIKAKYPCLMGR